MIKKIRKYLITKIIKYGIKNESKLIIKLALITSKVKIDFEQKAFRDTSKLNKLYYARFSRIYYYSTGIQTRINHLLEEYLIKNISLSIHFDEIIVDIGANIGEFSLGISNLLNNYNLICIEPDPTEFDVLKKNLKDLKKVKLYNYALSKKNSQMTFYLNNNSGDSSLDNKSENKIIVKTKTLDFLLRDIKIIGLIKLEAEGHEPEVLEGSFETLIKTKYITVDVGPERNHKSTFDSVHQILTKSNFKILKKGKIMETVLYYNQALVNH